jgi:putative copper export protein
LAAWEEVVTYSYVLLLHVLAATVWTGGHLVLATVILPRALSSRDPQVLLSFESRFERIGIPALLIQVITGVWMAHTLRPDLGHWLSPNDGASSLIALKLGLLLATAVTALDARLRIIPKLSAESLPALARRIVFVTLLSVGFVVVGVSFRGGLLV